MDKASLQPGPAREGRVASRTARGMLWAYGSFVGGRVLVLLSMVVLARELTPADFGLVALALVFITLLETVSDLGATSALVIAEEQDLAEQADTAWSFTVLLGALLSAGTAAGASLAAAAFTEPRLTSLLAVLGLVFFFRSLGLTHYALAQRRLDFRSRTAGEVADVAVRGVVAVGLALGGFGAWSLVLSYLAGSLTMTAVMWTFVPWRPSFRMNRRLLRTQLRFGGPLSADTILWAVIWNLDRAFVGRVLGTAALGFYTIASRLPDLVIANLSMVAERVLFPAYALLDREAMTRAFLLSLRYTLLLSLPCGVTLALLADPLIHALFGEKWAPAVPVMQALTASAVAATFAVPAGTVYKAIRRADILLWFTAPRLVLLIVALVVFGERGIVAVALCQAATSILADVLAGVLASRILGISLRRIATAVSAPVIVAVGVAAVVLPLEMAITSPWLTLATATVGATGTYAVLAWLTARESIRDLWTTLSPRRGMRGERDDVVTNPR